VRAPRCCGCAVGTKRTNYAIRTKVSSMQCTRIAQCRKDGLDAAVYFTNIMCNDRGNSVVPEPCVCVHVCGYSSTAMTPPCTPLACEG